MLDEQRRECCDLCSEPVGRKHADVGGRVVCLDCCEAIVIQIHAGAQQELEGMLLPAVQAAYAAAVECVQRRLRLISMN